MDTASWYQAAHSRPPVVLGLSLRPYSLGHAILLGRFKSGFEPGGDGDDSSQLCAELSLACLICSQKYQAALQFLESPWRVTLFLRIWRLHVAHKMRRSSPLRTGATHPAPRPYFQEELNKFLAYRQAAAWFPDDNSPIGGRALAAPWLFRWLAWLMAELHFTEEQALNYPLSRATALYCARQEQLGNLTLFNQSDDSLFALRDKLDAANAWDSDDLSAYLEKEKDK